LTTVAPIEANRSGPLTRPPSVFRIALPAKNLVHSRRFYESLLGIAGRDVAPGRIYFDCGPVIVVVLDHSERPATEWSVPAEAVYFETDRLEEIHRQAVRLGCVARGLLHGDPKSPMGEIVVRPWGERSFYVEDPSGNSLCFVDVATIFTGTPEQIGALRETSDAADRRS
jgi:extradiol dioxygenase family protein